MFVDFSIFYFLGCNLLVSSALTDWSDGSVEIMSSPPLYLL